MTACGSELQDGCGDECFGHRCPVKDVSRPHRVFRVVVPVAEGANMPSTIDAVNWFIKKGILYAPGKASNAGGVAVSGLEMSQNSLRMTWTREEVDARLKEIMKIIHQSCVKYGGDENHLVNYVKGANIGGFVKVADAMLAQGLV